MTVDDPGQDVGEVGKRVDVVELAGLDQGRDDGPVFGAAVGSGKALMQRTQMEGGMPNPVRQSRSIESDALAGIDLGLPIQRQMIGIFGYRSLGDGCFRRQSAPRSTGLEPGLQDPIFANADYSGRCSQPGHSRDLYPVVLPHGGQSWAGFMVTS
jgi:hypothetical protein